MSNGPVEPKADLRQAARELFGMYIALIQEGFTESQALRIIGYAIQGKPPSEET